MAREYRYIKQYEKEIIEMDVTIPKKDVIPATSFTSLTLNGISYATLKNSENTPYNVMQILNEEGNEGLSFEIMCKGKNVGNVLSRICSMQTTDTETYSLGFNISYNQASFSDGKLTITTPSVENEFSHIVFVINKTPRLVGKNIEDTYENYNPNSLHPKVLWRCFLIPGFPNNIIENPKT